MHDQTEREENSRDASTRRNIKKKGVRNWRGSENWRECWKDRRIANNCHVQFNSYLRWLRVEGRYQGSYLTFRLISCRHPLPQPPCPESPPFPYFSLLVPEETLRSMRKLLRQELLTINYSSRYPNLSVAPLLMQMTQRSPRALFGFSRSPYSLLPPIQRVNGKVGWKRRLSRYWPPIAAHLHFITTRTRGRLSLPPAPPSFPPPRPATFARHLTVFRLSLGGRDRDSKDSSCSNRRRIPPPSGEYCSFKASRETTPINYESVNECCKKFSLSLILYRNIGLYKGQLLNDDKIYLFTSSNEIEFSVKFDVFEISFFIIFLEEVGEEKRYRRRKKEEMKREVRKRREWKRRKKKNAVQWG